MESSIKNSFKICWNQFYESPILCIWIPSTKKNIWHRQLIIRRFFANLQAISTLYPFDNTLLMNKGQYLKWLFHRYWSRQYWDQDLSLKQQGQRALSRMSSLWNMERSMINSSEEQSRLVKQETQSSLKS